MSLLSIHGGADANSEALLLLSSSAVEIKGSDQVSGAEVLFFWEGQEISFWNSW